MDPRRHRRRRPRLAPPIRPAPPPRRRPLFLGDIAAVLLAGRIAALIAVPLVHLPAPQVAVVMLALCLPITAGYLLTGLYPGVALNPAVEFRQLSRVAAISLLGTAVLACLGQLAMGCVLLLAIAAPLQFFFAPLSRAAVRAVCGRRPWWGYPTIIFGSGPAAATVVDNLLRHPQYGLRPVLVLDRPGLMDAHAAAS